MQLTRCKHQCCTFSFTWLMEFSTMPTDAESKRHSQNSVYFFGLHHEMLALKVHCLTVTSTPGIQVSPETRLSPASLPGPPRLLHCTCFRFQLGYDQQERSSSLGFTSQGLFLPLCEGSTGRFSSRPCVFGVTSAKRVSQLAPA